MKTEMNFKLIVSLILTGFAVIFIIQNIATVDFRFILWSWHLPLALLMFFLLAIGILVGWMLHSYALHRRRRR